MKKGKLEKHIIWVHGSPIFLLDYAISPAYSQILVTFPLGRISESGEFLIIFCVHGLCSAFAKLIAFIEKILDAAFIPTLAYRDDNRLARFAFPIVSVSLV